MSDEPIIDESYRQALQRSFDGIRESAVFAQLFHPAMTELDGGDILPLFQLGAAIMFDKPIIVLLRQGMELPPKLAQLADRVIPFDPADMKATTAAMEAAMDELGIEK